MKWVKVTDELPKEGQRVIVVQNPETTATREALFAVYENFRFRDPAGTIDGIHMCVANWVDIIYWMPLPETPKEL